jgi:hypothetical protein
LEDLVTVSSAFYPELTEYYAEAAAEWVAEYSVDDQDEDDEEEKEG